MITVLSTGQCYTVDMRSNSTERVELQYAPNEVEDEAEQPSSRKKYVNLTYPISGCASLAFLRFSMTTARFSPDGMFIFVGTSRGDLLVYDLRCKQVSWLMVSRLKSC